MIRDDQAGETPGQKGHQTRGKKEVRYYLLNIYSLLRPPVTNTKNRKKITIKLGGLWGVKYVSSLDSYVPRDTQWHVKTKPEQKQWLFDGK